MALLQKAYLGSTALFRNTAWFEDDALTLVDATAQVTATADTVAHTKGAWTEIIASTSADSSFTAFRVFVGTNATNTATLLDIATGASGSETVVAGDIAVGALGGSIFGFPLKVPSGTRLSARIQSVVTGGKTAQVDARLYDAGDYATAPTTVDVIGTDTATSKGTEFSGSSGTWVEGIASTTQAYRGVCFVPSAHTNASGFFTGAFEIGVGASGSETAFGSTRVTYVNNETANLEFPFIYLFGRDIPSGSRLAVKHPITSNPTFYGFTLIGIP